MERTKFPKRKCNCGCGQLVSNNRYKYIKGHNLKLPLSEESELKRRQKISNTMRLFLKSPEEREKRRLVWKGRKHKQETKNKISKLRKGKGNGMYGKIPWNKGLPKEINPLTGRTHSKETRRKISESQKNKTIPNELREKISKTLKNYFKHNPNPFKGKHHTEESKEKMSRSLKGIYCGEKASNWQGGIDAFPYAIGWSTPFIESIRERDHHKCQNPQCDKPHKLLDVHHIDYDKQNNDLNNLITLCKRCHGKTQKHRSYWTTYYKRININKL